MARSVLMARNLRNLVTVLGHDGDADATNQPTGKYCLVCPFICLLLGSFGFRHYFPHGYGNSHPTLI